ncbi:right-handed parallel beta-helix repeat-containing protein [halophilic archaeon]|nr:right-handed parallel beta-helix repeat-containing protein [halophilic archaeon]
MDDIPRREFGTLLAASLGITAGCSNLMTSTQPTSNATESTPANEPNGAGNITVVTTTEELQAAFDDLSRGDTIRITDENAPYRTTSWLDIDVDGVTVVGPGVQTLVKPDTRANVGGIRIGHHERCREIDVRGVGYHGNRDNQGSSAERLHGISVRNAENVTITRNQIRETHPRKHGNGGSGISVTPRCSDVRIFNNQIHEFGDRGIQLGGKRLMAFGNVVTNGLDRPIACDLWYPDGKNRTAQSVSIFGNLVGNSVEGSLIGVARNTPTASNKGYVNVFGNVGFGSHKSFCHVRGPKALQNISIQNNVSLQKTAGLHTEQTTEFAGIAVDVAKGRNLAIRNNELYDYSGHGIHIDSDVEDVTVQQNSVIRPGLTGIRLVDATNGLVDGNLVTEPSEAGIRLKQTANLALRGNYVERAGTYGIETSGARSSGSGNDVAINYVVANDRRSDGNLPAILVRDVGTRVRGNTVRGTAGPAIAEADGAARNLYENNWADDTEPWQISAPSSQVRNHTPALGVHRNLSPPSGSNEIAVEFDKPYARSPRLAFGRGRTAVQDVAYETDSGGNYVGATITTEGSDPTLDVFVDAT